MKNDDFRKRISQMFQKLHQNKIGEEFMEIFDVNFEKVNHNFFEKLKELNLTFQLNNGLNKLYETNGYTYSYIYGAQTITENFYYPMAGRNFMAGINLKF